MILQPRRLHSMSPGYERLNILLHHDLIPQDCMTSKARQRIRHNSQHARRFLRHKLCGVHRSLVACLKLLVDLPGMLDFLRGLLEGAGDSLVGGPRVLVLFPPDHLIQPPLRPCREWFMVCIAEGYREPLKKFTRTMHQCGGRAKRRSTRVRTDRMVRIRVRGRGRCRHESTTGVYRDGSRYSWRGQSVHESIAEHTSSARLMFRSLGLELHYVHHEGAIAQVCTRSRMCPEAESSGVRDRSDVMRSVMMRGRRQCRELRGGLGAILGSDSEFRLTARAKFKVSRDVEICEARTLSTAIRLFTNSWRKPPGNHKQCKDNSSKRQLRDNTTWAK